MSKSSQMKVMEARSKDNQILFFKSQEDFAKVLREGVGAGDEIRMSEELMEEE